MIEDVDYRKQRGLDRALFQKLPLGGWIEARPNPNVGQSSIRTNLAWVPKPRRAIARRFSLGSVARKGHRPRGSKRLAASGPDQSAGASNM
jgi:hypothetical protein